MWFKSSRCDSTTCLETHFCKSSKCDANGNCLEARFQKSRYSENGHCVEATYQGVVRVRDSKYPDIVVSFDSASWTSFLDRIKSGVMERRSFA